MGSVVNLNNEIKNDFLMASNVKLLYMNIPKRKIDKGPAVLPSMSSDSKRISIVIFVKEKKHPKLIAIIKGFEKRRKSSL